MCSKESNLYLSFKYMRKRLSVFLIILISIFITACTDDKKDDETIEERKVPVEVTNLVIDNFIVTKSVTGRIEPKNITPVILQMPGELAELNIKNGDSVKKDDVIAKVKTQAGTIDIKAPESGEIIDLKAKEEDLLSGEEPLALIYKGDELKMTLTVTNNVRELFETDKTYKVSIENETYDLTIESIGKMPNETGLYPITSTVKNEKDRVLPGMIGVVEVPEKRLEKVFVLPTEAIIEESEGSFVYKVENEKAVKVEVRVLETQSDLTAIEGDLTEEDDIVINGQLTLSDGVNLVIVKEENES